MPVEYARHTCAGCGVSQSAFVAGACFECFKCMTCCDCTPGPTPHRKRRGSLPLTFHGTPNDLFPRYCGVEIECGLTRFRGSPLQTALQAWDAEGVSDGSIQLNNGLEVITAPACGEDFEAQVRDMCSGLARHGARVDKSCGYHVHVDARSVNLLGSRFNRRVDYSDLCRLAGLLDVVEIGLFSLVAPSRRKNRQYCAAWGTTFDRAGVLLADTLADKERTLDCAIYGSVDSARSAKGSGKYHQARYRSVNLHAFHCHGTVEFRLHHGTVDPDKIINWAAICVALVHWAFTHSDADLALMVKGSSAADVLNRIVSSGQVCAWMQNRREHFAVKRARTGALTADGTMVVRRRRRPAIPLPEVTRGITPEASEM